ncbi:MAG: DUF58 domain-containing protein, partial [Bauldia sp.]|nr:DUF58 domain-containing protein [Bauldia sp.]
RRTSGRGETFWQFRPFVTGEAAASIDWRRSARDEHLFVREREWEAAHTMWLWADLSASMEFRSRLSQTTKRARAIVLTLALAEMLSVAGERIGLLGASDPILTRNGAERLAERIPAAAKTPAPPDTRALRRFSDIVLFGDFLDPIAAIEKTLDAILRSGARAHLVQVIDPIEEAFPYAGRTEFFDPETGTRHVVSRAEHYREDYQARLAALREYLRTLCRRIDWTFLVHRTDRPATEPLLALHARLADRQNSLGLHAGRAA